MAAYTPIMLVEKDRDTGRDVGLPLIEHYDAIIARYRDGGVDLTTSEAGDDLKNLFWVLRHINEKIKGAGIMMKDRREYCRLLGDVVALIVRRKIEQGKINSEEGIREFLKSDYCRKFRKVAGRIVPESVVERSVRLLRTDGDDDDGGEDPGSGSTSGSPSGIVRESPAGGGSSSAAAFDDSGLEASELQMGANYMMTGNIAAAAGVSLAVRLPI